jgi:aspartate/glutamate racemase
MKPPRIALIHALPESVGPANAAMASLWPDAQRFNLADDSLAPDLAAAGAITPSITQRFLDLARYAAGTGARGLLFTCSAFGTSIDACKSALPVPILKPNEAALDEALRAGRRIALLATFAPTIASMRAELEAAAKTPIEIVTATIPAALAALKAGRGDEHDRLIADAAAALPPVDALILAQFSMARAAPRIAPLPSRVVITTPESAVRKLRSLVERAPAR